MRSQFGVRNGIRIGGVSSRSPIRLAGLGVVSALALLGALALARAALQAAQSEGASLPEESNRA